MSLSLCGHVRGLVRTTAPAIAVVTTERPVRPHSGHGGTSLHGAVTPRS
jgi:hypothetical protein